MLGKQAGAEATTLRAKHGWQAHTTRAARTGLRKTGFEITSEPGVGGTRPRSRISAEPSAAESR